MKGVLLAPSANEDVERSIPELSDEFEVVVSKRGDIDHILLKVELNEGIARARSPDVEGRPKTELRLKTYLGYKLEFHNSGLSLDTNSRPRDSRMRENRETDQ